MRRIDRLTLTAMLVTGLALGAVLAASETPQRTGIRAAPGPGAAAATSAGGTLVLFNQAVSGTWKVENDRFKAVSFDDRENGRTIALPAAVFSLVLDDGRVLQASDMKVTAAPRVDTLAGDSGASRMVERLPGRQIAVTLESADPGLRATWNAVLRDGSNYLRQVVTLQTTGADVPVREVRLVDLQLSGSEVVGTVKGSPVVSGNLFLGFEHPLSMSRVEQGRVVASLPRELPIRSGSPVTYSSVIGVVHPGQLRRDFLRYVERERAHPYRTFLHYNSWYDLGYFNKYHETGALDRINAFGAELHNRRGVTLDSFLFDDGWDDPASLWHFHSGFPNGFVPLRDAAAKYGAAPGIWLSPWGGYGKPKEERLQHGREAGFETNARGFALSGPKYFARFRETCLQLIREAGVNQFKIDGTGNVNSAIPGSRFDSDFAAAIALIADLRAAKPDLYVNLTTGTYPSPFWLQVGRLDLARRRGPQLCRRRHLPPALDHVSGCGYVQGDRPEGAAVSVEFTDVARAHLRAIRQEPRHRSRRRFRERGARLLRHRDATAGDVHHAVAPEREELGRARAGGEVVARECVDPRRYALGRRRPRCARRLRLGSLVAGERHPDAAKPER